MTAPADATPSPGRRLGLFGATMVGVGAMVGAGIFVLCGVAVRVAGPSAILAFALNGAVTLITAFSFAELAAAFPEAGGSYVFAKKVFPIGPAFAAGWVLWFAYVVACALYSLGFAGFVVYGVEEIAAGLGAPLEVSPHFGVALAVAAALAAALLLALRGPGAGNAISFGKVVAFLVLITVGLLVLFARPAGTVERSFSPFLPFGAAGILTAMGFTFVALEGYEIIATVSEEIRSPARTVPRAMFLSIAITLVIYLGLLFVLLTVGGPEGGEPAWRDLGRHGETAVAVGAQRYGGSLGAIVVLVAGLLATFSALAATLLAASRVSFAMARDRALPRALSGVRGAAGTPVVALAMSGVLVAVVVLVTASVEVAGAAASLIFLLSFALANGAGLLVRARVGPREGFQAPLYPLLPLVGVASCLGLAIFQASVVPAASFVALAWLVLGGLMYATLLRRSAETVAARAEAFDADLVRLRGRTPLVLVPIASPDRAEPLVQLGQALAAPGVGRVLMLAVAPYDPERMPTSGIESYGRAEAAVRRAVAAACTLGRPFEGVVRLASDVTEAIVATATERHPETILLGMSRMDQAGGPAILERVIARTTADVVVLNAPAGWSLGAVRRVLVPVAGDTPHNPLRARILGMLLREGERAATVLRVLLPGEEPERARRVLETAADDLGLAPTSCLLEQSPGAVASIVRHSEDADLVVLGLGSREARHRLIGDFVLAVVGGARCPVIAVAQALRSRRYLW
ncbi:MAG: amino acid permease [Planctomycetota bacterium]